MGVRVLEAFCPSRTFVTTATGPMTMKISKTTPVKDDDAPLVKSLTVSTIKLLKTLTVLQNQLSTVRHATVASLEKIVCRVTF